MKEKTIVIVSGLPRSGTSMIMQMLQAGGVRLLTDDWRKPDEDNPKGYYELERVKTIKKDKSWLRKAQGKAVKIISFLLKYLPEDYNYQLIFINRDIKEILLSQRQMLMRRKKAVDKTSDRQLARSFRRHLKEIKDWLGRQTNIKTLYLDYRKIIADPMRSAQTINRFLGGNLDSKAMVAAVDKKLYRQRLDR